MMISKGICGAGQIRHVRMYIVCTFGECASKFCLLQYNMSSDMYNSNSSVSKLIYYAKSYWSANFMYLIMSA